MPTRRTIAEAAWVMDRRTSGMTFPAPIWSELAAANSRKNGGMVTKMAIWYAIWKRRTGFGVVYPVISRRWSRVLKNLFRASCVETRSRIWLAVLNFSKADENLGPVSSRVLFSLIYQRKYPTSDPYFGRACTTICIARRMIPGLNLLRHCKMWFQSWEH